MTNEKARIFAKYSNSTVTSFFDSNAAIKSIDFEDNEITILVGDGFAEKTIDIERVRLELYELYSISDAHKLEAYEAIGMDLYVQDWTVEYFLKCFSPYECSETKDRYGQKCYYQMQDYLRSQSYDLDGLIEKGWAIKKEVQGE